MDDNFKIVLVISVLKDGGAEHVMIMLANYFKKKGIPVEMVVTNQKSRDSIIKGLESNIPIYYLEDNINVVRQKNIMQKVISAICRFFNFCGFKVPNIMAKISFEQYYGNHLNEMKKVLYNHNNWTVLAFLQPANQIVMKAADGLSNRIYLSERADPFRYFQTRYAKYFLNYYYPKLAGMIFQTPNAEQAYKKIIQCNGVVIPNPVSSVLPLPWNGSREKTIVNFCRLAKQKNLPMLLDAFEIFYKNHRDYKLIIYGDGELREELLHNAEMRSCSNNIQFIAHQKDIHNVILKAGMFVSSSDFEGMSNSMLEAMALGLPVVCTDCPIGGAAAVIRNYENGILVPVNDAVKMAEEMAYIADNSEFARKIGRNASQIRITQSEEAICQRWYDFLCEN